ncbi:PRC-barrel domain-containing protein [Mycobacterium sp. HM-7]
MSDVDQLVGATAYDLSGAKIGKIHQVYLDQSGQPSWVTVHLGLLGIAEPLVPLAGVRHDEDGSVRLAVAKDIIKTAPPIDSADHVTAAEEGGLLEHYGMSAEQATGLEAVQSLSSTSGRRLLGAAAAAAGIGGTAANTAARTAEPEPSADD